jgi:UPF0271 protein
MKLNADLGEGMGCDELIMPIVDMANIAAGGHAGDYDSIRTCLLLAQRYGVEVGIHPSYPDKAGFGRQTISLSNRDLLESLNEQCHLFMSIADELNVSVSYIKPHGALYNDLITSNEIFATVLECAASLNRGLALMVLALPNSQPFIEIADKYGVPLLFESFADRAYQDNGQLVPRTQSGACLAQSDALSQARQLCSGSVTTISGKSLILHSDSLCVHGDNPAALALAKAIKYGLSV